MKNMILATGLMFSIITTTLPIYEQEREVLYAMHAVGQDFADAGFVKQNLEMFISVFETNSQLLEKKLAVVNQNAKNRMVKNFAILAASMLSKSLKNAFFSPKERFHGAFLSNIEAIAFMGAVMGLNLYDALAAIGATWIAIDLHDMFKERNALKEALALDQDILEQLLTIKDLALFSFDDDKSEEAIDASDASTEVAK